MEQMMKTMTSDSYHHEMMETFYEACRKDRERLMRMNRVDPLFLRQICESIITEIRNLDTMFHPPASTDWLRIDEAILKRFICTAVISVVASATFRPYRDGSIDGVLYGAENYKPENYKPEKSISPLSGVSE